MAAHSLSVVLALLLLAAPVAHGHSKGLRKAIKNGERVKVGTPANDFALHPQKFFGNAQLRASNSCPKDSDWTVPLEHTFGRRYADGDPNDSKQLKQYNICCGNGIPPAGSKETLSAYHVPASAMQNEGVETLPTVVTLAHDAAVGTFMFTSEITGSTFAFFEDNAGNVKVVHMWPKNVIDDTTKNLSEEAKGPANVLKMLKQAFNTDAPLSAKFQVLRLDLDMNAGLGADPGIVASEKVVVDHEGIFERDVEPKTGWAIAQAAEAAEKVGVSTYSDKVKVTVFGVKFAMGWQFYAAARNGQPGTKQYVLNFKLQFVSGPYTDG